MKNSETSKIIENAKKSPRNESEGMKNFTKEMISALGTALIFIAFVIQAFTIPTGSMERSLLVGDFLLGVKLMYGTNIIPKTSNLPILNRLPLPDTYWKLPGLKPKAGDVIIFEYPGFPSPAKSPKKRYIKRCVAVAGDTVEVIGTDLFVNNIRQTLPPKGQFISDSISIQQSGTPIPSEGRVHFKPLYIPRAGDTLQLSNLDIREYHFYKNLIRQENPHSNVEQNIALTLRGIDVSDKPIKIAYDGRRQEWYPYLFSKLLGELDTTNYWTNYDAYFQNILHAPHIADKEPEITKSIRLDGKELAFYVVQQDNYFMMGDNRDNSADSRYWGFLNRNFVEAQALIVYFSFENNDRKFKFTNPLTWWRIPGRIRYNRMGKLIRTWEGTPEDIEANRKEVLYAPDPMGELIDSVQSDTLTVEKGSVEFEVE